MRKAYGAGHQGLTKNALEMQIRAVRGLQLRTARAELAPTSDLGLFGQLKSIVDLNAKVADS